MRSDQQNDFPFCPVSDPLDVTEDYFNEDDLPDEPKQLDSHPEQKVRLKSHFPNERVAQHDRVDLPVTTKA